MVVRLLVVLLLALMSQPAAAACTGGRDLLAGLTDQDRAALVGDAPFARGNLWRATKGTTTITLAGTFHLDDPRFDAMMPILEPQIRSADLLLVEAGPEEEARLKADTVKHPERMFITTGATLPERLPEAEWQALSTAMRARGIPPFLAAKFQPWYVSMLLGVPPCAMDALRGGAQGLDHRVIATAEAAQVPVQALEPFDTVFRVFDQMTATDQTDMIRGALAQAGDAEDMFATMTRAYFAGEHRLIWEFSRATALATPGWDKADLEREFGLIEARLLTGRNHAWMPVLLGATQGKTAFVAVGAAHLSGPEGILNLLHQAGFTLTPLPL